MDGDEDADDDYEDDNKDDKDRGEFNFDDDDDQAVVMKVKEICQK